MDKGWFGAGFTWTQESPRLLPGALQLSQPRHVVGCMLTTRCAPHTGDAPGHNPGWPCSFQQQQQHEGFHPSWPVPFPEQRRHPAAPHQHQQHQQVKEGWGCLKTRGSSKPEEKQCTPTCTPWDFWSTHSMVLCLWAEMFTGPEGLHCNKIHKNSNLFYTSNFSCTALRARAPRQKCALLST